MTLPDVPLFANEQTSHREILKHYTALADRLQGAALGHVSWYTHKRDGGMYCWICDYGSLVEHLLRELENAYKVTKSG